MYFTFYRFYTLMCLLIIKVVIILITISLIIEITEIISQSTRCSDKHYSFKGGDPAARSRTATLLRLHPSHLYCPRRLPPLRVRPTVSSTPNSHGVTGGVYKTRERIHPDILIRDY